MAIVSNGIVFQVETTRILQILSREIYDSPLALLRENLQNAYDAIRMRFAGSGTLQEGGRIDIVVANGQISITDNGVGMDEAALRNNFWKAGSSGKHSETARRAGVVGTFGIGAMANFGVCTRLVVETRADNATKVIRSVAERDTLRIAEECITLEEVTSTRDVGTTVTAVLDNQHVIGADAAKEYLKPYVGLLPVPVYLNDALISRGSMESRLSLSNRQFSAIGDKNLSDNLFAASFQVEADPNGQTLVRVSEVRLGGNPVEGSMLLLQSGGQLMGLRSSFGLAPIPATGHLHFGGFANLSFLQPTAGREALSRESIEQVSRLLTLAERAAAELLAETTAADKNAGFLQWIVSHGRYDLSRNVTIYVLPDKCDVPLGRLKEYVGKRTVHYYIGADPTILSTFSSEGTCLLQVAQGNPRRAIQHRYVSSDLHFPQVPDSAQVIRSFIGSDLNVREASVILRITSILREDYLISDVDAVLAEISHGVTILPKQTGGKLVVYLARSASFLPPLFEAYDKAYDLFTHIMKDFVRVNLYHRIQQFVPSSTRDGVDALRKLLEKNRELYRYEETERGDLEGILGEYLSGEATLSQVIVTARAKARSHSQSVSRDQVGAIESVVPDVVESTVTNKAPEGAEFDASPPIIRDDILSDKKLLTTDKQYPQLNNFTMLLGLSDRLMQTEAEFFRAPHTTRILWGGHRVIYIFTDATGRLSLYYDIQLRDSIGATNASAGNFLTTTLITKKRIFVPVPDALAEEFKVTAAPKEFFVRFDILYSGN